MRLKQWNTRWEVLDVVRCLMQLDVLASQSAKRNPLYPHPAVLVIPPGISSHHTHLIPPSALHLTERTSSSPWVSFHRASHLPKRTSSYRTCHFAESILTKRVTHLCTVLFITVFLSQRCASHFTVDISTMNSTYTWSYALSVRAIAYLCTRTYSGFLFWVITCD